MVHPISLPFDPSKHPAQLDNVAFERALVLFIPQAMFKPNARCFGDTKDIKSISPIAHALQAFAHLVYHPEMCALAAEGGDPPEPSHHPSWYFTPDDGTATPQQKTRQFVEVVYATDQQTIVGWRWFVFSVDTNVDLGAGVFNLIHHNGSEYHKSKKQPRFKTAKPSYVLEGFRKILSLSDWAYGVCDSYMNARVMVRQKETINDRQAPLFAISNPANPYAVFTLERAVNLSDGACASQCNTAAYKSYDSDTNARYRFPSPENVWEVDTEYFNPGVVTRMEFPTEKKHHCASPLGELCLFQPNADGGEYREQILDIMDATHGFSRSEFNFKRQSDLSVLAQIATKIKRREMATLDSETAKQKWLSNFKRGVMEDFRKFWCPESSISSNIKHMMEWESQQRLEADELGTPFTFTVSHTPIDTALSPFANLMIRRFVQFEKLLKTSTVHRELFITIISMRDAYRRSFDLHTNPLLCGAGSSSKSYILNKAESVSIPRTVQTVTHITAKADAIDENQNDIVTLFHEMPKSLMGYDEIGTTGDPMFKERLTSNKFKTKLFCVDEDTGKRSNRVAESECIGVIGGCSNDPPGKIPEALRSRFLIIMCPQIVRKNHEVVDQFADGAMSPSMKRAKDKMIFEHQCEQYLLCLVFKLQWCQVLCEVNLRIAHTIFRNVLENLQKEGVRSKDPRQYTRLENTARVLTIMNAINIVFNTPGGALYKKPFNVRDMLALEPHLLCTEEIAYFTISLLQDMYTNPVEREVAKTVSRFMVGYAPGTPTLPIKECKYRADPESQGDDLNYVLVKAEHVYLVAHRISSRMKKNKSSPENIQAVLFDLMKRTVSAADRNILGSPPKTFTIFEMDKASKAGYFSTAWLDRVLDDEYANLMRKVIKGTFHAHSRKRTILLGETHLSDDMPHIWRTLDVVPNPDHRLVVQNTSYKTVFEQTCLFGAERPPSTNAAGYASHPSFNIDSDLEAVEFLKHLDDIGADDQTDQSALPQYREEQLRDYFPESSSNVYPHQFIHEYKSVLTQQGEAKVKYSESRVRKDGSARQLQPHRKKHRANTQDAQDDAHMFDV